jgi:integrase
MASITKTRSGKYYCQIRCKGCKPLNKTFPTHAEADLWAREQEQALHYQTPPTCLEGETLQDIGLRYCLTVLKGKPSRNETSLRVKRMAKHFPQAFGAITQRDVNNYRLTRLETVTPTTCRDEMVLLNRLFKWVTREYLIEIDNPCQGVIIPRALKPRDKVVTPDEMEQLLAVMTPIMSMVIELAYETAMRRAELLKLTPEGIHLEERLLDVIDGKTGSRSVPLSRRAVEILRKAMERCPSPQARLFPVTGVGVTQALRRARRKLGLSEDIRVHQLRHSRISLVARKGFNNAQIMAVSGHKDVRSVQRYTHLNAADVVDLLD